MRLSLSHNLLDFRYSIINKVTQYVKLKIILMKNINTIKKKILSRFSSFEGLNFNST